MPPALVERWPPIWQLPSAASDSGKSRPASSAARWMLASTQPASTVIVSFSGSSSRTRFMRASATMISRAWPVGTEPPVSKVGPGVVRGGEDVGGAYNVAQLLDHRFDPILLWRAT